MQRIIPDLINCLQCDCSPFNAPNSIPCHRAWRRCGLGRWKCSFVCIRRRAGSPYPLAIGYSPLPLHFTSQACPPVAFESADPSATSQQPGSVTLPQPRSAPISPRYRFTPIFAGSLRPRGPPLRPRRPRQLRTPNRATMHLRMCSRSAIAFHSRFGRHHTLFGLTYSFPSSSCRPLRRLQ